MNFFYDEWDFVTTARPWNISVLLLPHNEHWSTIPIVIWKLFFLFFGLRTHVPYEAALLAAHVASVILLFLLIRGRSGDLPAFAAGLILLLLGSGGTDITWAFQIGFVGSVAFGLLAMLFVETDAPFPWRLPAASAALLCSLMCSGVGLAFVVALGVQLALDRRRRRFLLALVVPVATFAEWFLAYDIGSIPGSPGVSQSLHHGSIGPSYVLSLASFIASGVEASTASAFGQQGFGAILLPILALVLALHWYRSRGIAAWQVGMTAGVIAWFALVGVGRAQNGSNTASDPHYVYVGAVFMLPLIADAARELPWRGYWRPLLGAAFALSLLGNTVQLVDVATSRTSTMIDQSAELRTVEVFRGAPDMALDRSLDDEIMPQLVASRYFSATDELGSPVASATVDTLRALPAQAVDRVMVNLFGWALSVQPDPTRSVQGLPCHDVDATTGSTMDFQVPSASSFMVEASTSGDAVLFLGFMHSPTSEPVQRVRLVAATPEWVYLPNTGKPMVWQLRIRTTPAGVIKVCVKTSPQVRQTTGSLYSSGAASGKLDPNWSSISDPEALGGRASELPSGTTVSSLRGATGPSYMNDVFGAQLVPVAGPYDIWYRVRVTSRAGATTEMTLGLWDVERGAWVGSTYYSANQVRTKYSWIRVAAAVTPTAGHHVEFVASFTAPFGLATLDTDWFIDEAIMVPASTPSGNQSAQAAENLYIASAANGVLDAGWTRVFDPGASSGRAARLARGTMTLSFTNDVFGDQILPQPGSYDVWFRARTTTVAGTTPEMTFGVWDDTGVAWVGSTAYADNQVGSNYVWIKAAAGVSPLAGHYVQFAVSFTSASGPTILGTDWYVDEGVMVPMASPVWPAT